MSGHALSLSLLQPLFIDSGFQLWMFIGAWGVQEFFDVGLFFFFPIL